MNENKIKKIEFFKRILQKFNDENIKYAILRNYEFLLGQDYPIESLDTVVAKEDMPKVSEILRSFGFYERTQQFSLAHKAYFKLINLEKVSFDIQVGGIHWNDMVYLDESILKDRKLERYFYTLSDDDYFVMLLVHSILGKRYFKLKYSEILSQININQEQVIKKLSSIFSSKISLNLLKKINEDDFNNISMYKIIIYFLIKKPTRIIILFNLFFRWFIQRKNPFKLAPLISILGPDGSGKSSMVEELTSFLIKNNRKISTVYSGRGRGHILPITYLGRKYKSKEKKKDKISNQQIKDKKTIKRRILYTLLSPIYSLDLLLRYFLIMLPKRIKGNIVITDRYGSDIILMENVSFWFKKVMYKLFPKPTITIFLYNTPEILHQRRPEESIKELNRQMNIFKKFNYNIELKTTNQKENHDFIKTLVFVELLKKWY